MGMPPVRNKQLEGRGGFYFGSVDMHGTAFDEFVLSPIEQCFIWSK